MNQISFRQTNNRKSGRLGRENKVLVCRFLFQLAIERSYPVRFNVLPVVKLYILLIKQPINHPIGVPLGSLISGFNKTTSPFSGIPPRTNTSDLKPAIRRGGKLTTPMICSPIISSATYLFVICALEAFIPISCPKSISSLIAGTFASAKTQL